MAIFEKETKTIVGYGTTLSFPISHNMPATSYILSVFYLQQRTGELNFDFSRLTSAQAPSPSIS